jgi:hypothetical protein
LGLLQHRALRFAWGTINSPAVVDVRENTQTANVLMSTSILFVDFPASHVWFPKGNPIEHHY